MTGFMALVRVFVRDLVRRRLLWVLALLTIGGVLVNYWTLHSIEEATGNGATWDMATKRAASGLDELASTVRGWTAFLVIALGAQVAPESRRNGTTQFVLSLGVRRDVLAAAQFVALALILTSGIFILHIGLSIAGLRTGAMSVHEALLAWPMLLATSLCAGAAVLAVSLTSSAIETYLIFIGIPAIANMLPMLAHGFPHHFPQSLAVAWDNVMLLFPDPSELVSWPHTSFGRVDGYWLGTLAWPTAHACLAVGFWIVLGLWRQRRHDFGSRAALK
ncbi:MAG: hypothetical protein ACLP1X_21655 [Polyangiaceae bacterium]